MVSVIIPTYNAERFISRAISSVLQQSSVELEIVVVDDGSTDRTVEVLKSFHDSRIRIYCNSRNMGPSFSRNQAIDNALGDWIAVLDADDWYALDRLRVLVDIAEGNRVDMVADDVHRIKQGDETPYSTNFLIAGFSFDQEYLNITTSDLLKSEIPNVCCPRIGNLRPIIRREFLQDHEVRYNDRIRYSEDLLFYFTCLAKGAKFLVVNKPFYYREERGSSLIGAIKREELLLKLIEVNELMSEISLSLKDQEISKILLRRKSDLLNTVYFFRILSSIFSFKLLDCIKVIFKKEFCGSDFVNILLAYLSKKVKRR